MGALQTPFTDCDTRDYRFRSMNYEKAMESLHQRYANDQQAALFYALALNVTALPTEKIRIDRGTLIRINSFPRQAEPLAFLANISQ